MAGFFEKDPCQKDITPSREMPPSRMPPDDDDDGDDDGDDDDDDDEGGRVGGVTRLFKHMASRLS